MESPIWHPPAGSVALWGEGSEKGQCLCLLFCLGESCPPAPSFVADTSVPPCMPLVGCVLHVPGPGIKPTTLLYQDNALTNSATQRGPWHFSWLCISSTMKDRDFVFSICESPALGVGRKGALWLSQGKSWKYHDWLKRFDPFELVFHNWSREHREVAWTAAWAHLLAPMFVSWVLTREAGFCTSARTCTMRTTQLLRQAFSEA